MAVTLRELTRKALEEMPLSRRLQGLTPAEIMEGLTPTEIMEGLTPDERHKILAHYLKDISVEEIERYLRILKNEEK